MEPETNKPEVVEEEKVNRLHTITPLSKYLAMVIFIILPFIGGWIGYNYAPEKVVEVERVIETEKVVVKPSKELDFFEGVGTVKDHVLENMIMGPYVELEIIGQEEPLYVIYGPYGETTPVECEYAEGKHFAVGDSVEFRGEVVKEIDGQEPVSKIITTCHKADNYIKLFDAYGTFYKDEFVGAISTVIKKDDGYYLVSGGEFGVNMVSYKIPDEDSLSKTIFKLIEGSHRINKEYKISDNVDIELISYQRGENDDNRYYVDVSVLYDVYQGGIDKFYYYALPGEDYPFEIIMVDDKVVSINQIYVE